MYDFGVRSVPSCSDCDENGHCTMNCGPNIPSVNEACVTVEDSFFTEVMGFGEPARLFDGNVRVWSEMAVRAAILKAVQRAEKKKPLDSDSQRA